MVRAVALIYQLLATPISSETIAVGNASVDLATFACRDINRSSMVQRVCYDASQRTLLVAIRGAYQHYCGVPNETYDALMNAPAIRNTRLTKMPIDGADGRYACRTS